MQEAGKTLLRRLLLALTLLTLVNLLLTASLAGLIGGILTLIMVWGIRRGDYGLRKALVVFLFLYARRQPYGADSVHLSFRLRRIRWRSFGWGCTLWG